MAIRTESDPLSNVNSQKHIYFKKQDTSANNLNFNRFFYMKPGDKNLYYDWRLDFSKLKISFEKFIINQEKYVNRPDTISFDVYGNAKYWWIIAMANDVLDPFIDFYKGRELRIPEFNAFKKELGL
jgi:hypothetical protein